MGTVLKGGTVVELEPASVEPADLRVEGGRIVARAPELQPEPGDEVVSCAGRLLMPGLVSAHHRLGAVLAQGAPRAAVQGYEAHLQQVLWPLENALDPDGLGVAAAAGALEALRCGTTCLFELHAPAPGAVEGALGRVARALHGVGTRAVLALAVTDRHGPELREAALAETASFARSARGLVRAQAGAAHLYTLSDEGLSRLAQLVKALGTGLHAPLAEDPTDERLSVAHFGATSAARLVRAGLLGPDALLAHVGHLAWPELSQLIATGAWLAHTPRANQALEVGYAPALKFGARAVLGLDGMGGDALAEAQAAALRAREAGQPLDVLHLLANGHRLASRHFGLPVGPLREGAAADLLVLDYRPLSPLTADTLAHHVVAGLGSRHVESVMVDGAWRLRARQPVTVNPDVLAQHAREAAARLWARAWPAP